jgi:hypothetical protein
MYVPLTEELLQEILFAKFRYNNSFRTAQVKVLNFRYTLKTEMMGCIFQLIKGKKILYRSINSVKFFKKNV